MNKSYYNINFIKKISIVLILLPVFISNYLSEQFGITSMVFLILLVIPFCFTNWKSLFISFNYMIKINYIKLLFLYLIYCSFTLAFTQDFSAGLNMILLFIVSVILGLLFSQYKVIEIYKHLAWSGLIYTIVLYLGIPNLYFNYYTESQRFAYYHGDISLNPNYFSILLSFFGMYFLYKFISTKNYKLLHAIPLLMIIFFIIETHSRSGLYTFSIVSLISFLLFAKKSILTYISGAFLTALLFIFIFTNINFSNNVDTRITELDLNNRNLIWEVGIEKSLEDPYKFIFGYGKGTSEFILGESNLLYSVINDEGKARTNAHNMYIENLLNLGIIGLSLLILFSLYLIKFFYRKFEYNTSLVPILIYGTIIISGLMGNQMRTYYFCYCFCLL